MRKNYKVARKTQGMNMKGYGRYRKKMGAAVTRMAALARKHKAISKGAAYWVKRQGKTGKYSKYNKHVRKLGTYAATKGYGLRRAGGRRGRKPGPKPRRGRGLTRAGGRTRRGRKPGPKPRRGRGLARAGGGLRRAGGRKRRTTRRRKTVFP